jgi:hypothetical protein
MYSEIVRKDRRLSIQIIAENINMEETVRQIVYDRLNIRKVCENCPETKRRPERIVALMSWNKSQNNWIRWKISSHTTNHELFNAFRRNLAPPSSG